MRHMTAAETRDTSRLTRHVRAAEAETQDTCDGSGG